jgi:GTP-binding protein YchF
MEVGIIGLPRSGKTTLFNAITKGKASVDVYSDKANVGVAKVPDERLIRLAKIYNPRRLVNAEIAYTDVPPPPEGFGRTRGIGGEYLNLLQAVDALLIVVRCFNNPAVAHVDETIDYLRDAGNMLMELIISDMEIIERRITRIQVENKGATLQERQNLKNEENLLMAIKKNLDMGIGLRDQGLSDDEIKRLGGFGLLSMKPVIVVSNIGEDQLDMGEQLNQNLWETINSQNMATLALCAQLEMDLAQMDANDEIDFRRAFGIKESSLERMVKTSYGVVGLIAFFTVGEDEVRAWEIKSNTKAQKAAGKIHSDLERGFIRAEVIAYDDLVANGNLVEAKKKGLVRQEGKQYVVQDGDIMHVLFNV